MVAIANRYNWACNPSGTPDIAANMEAIDKPKEFMVKIVAKIMFVFIGLFLFQIIKKPPKVTMTTL